MITFKELLETNVVNFLIMAWLLYLIWKKANLTGLIENMANKTRKTVEGSIEEKENAQKKLKNVENEVKDVSKITYVILEEAQKSASLIQTKIEDETKEALENINKNTENNIEKTQDEIKNNLIKEISQDSLDRAREKIEKSLSEQTHKQIVLNTIEMLDDLEILETGKGVK